MCAINYSYVSFAGARLKIQALLKPILLLQRINNKISIINSFCKQKNRNRMTGYAEQKSARTKNGSPEILKCHGLLRRL